MSSPSSRLAFDSHRFGSGRIGDEVGRRQEEWEREIETLDQKEMELHQSQLRLIREQTAIFIRDLGLLQGEVSALKENVGIGLSSNIMPLQNDVKEQKAKLLSQEQIITTTQKRVEYLERLLGESVERHSQEIESAKSAHVRLADEAKAREAHHASVAERLNYIEQLVGDSFERHSKEIQASHTRLETMHSRLVACESDANHKSLRERVDFLEKLLGESVDKHSEGLQAAHSNLQKLHGSLQEQMSTRMEKLHGNVQERLQAIEKQLGQVDDRREAHARELQQVKSQVDQAHQKLGNPTKPQSSLHHATMAERMEYLEKLMGDSADKHSSELGQAHTKLDQLRSRLTDLEAARDRHHAHIQELAGREKEARDKQHEHHKELLGRERAANEAHHASVAERLKYIEQLVGDSCERHSKEIQASHTRLETMHGRLVACESDASHKSLRERVDFLEKLLGESADKHSEGLQAAHSNLQKLHGSLQEQMSTRMDKLHGNVQERLQAIEKQLGQVDDRREAHARELQQVKSQVDQAHQKVGNPTKPQSSLHHATMAERMEYLEKLMGDSADKHSSELGQAHTKLDQLRGRLTDLEAARDRHHAHIQELAGREKEARDKQHEHHKELLGRERAANEAHHASVAERLKYIEQLVGDSCERHSKEIQASHTRLETMHGRLVACESDASHKSLRERVDFLEKLLGESADKHSEGLQAAHSNLQKLHGSLQEQMSTRMDKLHGNVQERLQAIEKQLGQVDDRREAHARELQQVKSQVDQAHQKLGNPTKPQSSLHHATMAERMEYLEKLMGDSADKHSSELGQAHTKLDQLRGRLTTLEAARDQHHAHIQELVGREKEARDKQHEHHQELLGRERAANEGRHRDIHEVIQKERKAREQHHGMLHDLVHKEKAARGAIEELLAQEKAERSKHHSSFEERIESVQKTLGIFDSLLRKEIEERTKEYRRLWDAIDTHTHDLSTQVIGEASGYTPEMADPPRRYPLASAPVQQGWTSGVQPIVYQEPVVTSLPPTPGIRQLSPMVQVQPASSWGVQAK